MKKLVIALAALALAGCGGSTVALSARAGARQTKAQALQQALTLSNGIALDRVRILIKKVDLEHEGENDDTEMEAGPTVLDLSGAGLEGSPQKLVDMQVAPGSYADIEYKIEKLSADDPAAKDAKFADLIAEKATVIIDGTIDGAAFHFASGLEVEQKAEHAFNVGEGGNITFNLDPASWFTDGNGGRLDPREGANLSAIEDNIKRSLDAYNDDDSNGVDDEVEGKD